MSILHTTQEVDLTTSTSCWGRCRRNKSVVTAAIYWGFTSLGLLVAALGPSLLSLQRQTGASAEALSFVFTLRSIGYLVGSATSGSLLDKFPNGGTKFLAGTIILTAICTLLVPEARTVVALGALCSTQGLAMGFLDTIGNVLVILLHGSRAGPWMQGLHFVFAVGALSAPLCVRLAMELSADGQDASGGFQTFAVFTLVGGLWFACLESPKARGNATAGAGSQGEGVISNKNAAVPVVDQDQKRCCRCCTVDRGIILTVGALLGLYVGGETGFGFVYSSAM